MKKYILLYFSILLLIVALRTSLDAPSVIFRSLFLLAFFIPIFTKYQYLYLPCLITFISISLNHFAFGYFPYDMASYAIISIIGLLAYLGFHPHNTIKINVTYFFCLLYVIIINTISSGSPEDISYCIMAIGIGALFSSSEETLYKQKNMLLCFVIISLFLTIIYLINYEQFIVTYNEQDGLERSGWTDPNYLSCIIGMGVISSLILLLERQVRGIYYTSLLIVTIGLSLIAQLLLASRGGLVAVAVGIIILVLFCKIKLWSKILTIVILTFFIIWLYSNNYFELLIYRVAEDSGGGSGRVDIWQMKLQEFSLHGNVLNWLFGMGHSAAINMSSTGWMTGFHNDFIAIFCSYGIIGLSVFIYMLIIYPLKKCSNSTRPITFALVLYLVFACMTLEPLSSGRLTYWAFYYLILLYAHDE